MGRHTISLMQLGEKFSTAAEGTSNREWRETKMHAISRIVERELTGRQRECVQLYYFNGYTVAQVGRLLCLNKSTVSRHLKAARTNISRLLCYREEGGGSFH